MTSEKEASERGRGERERERKEERGDEKLTKPRRILFFIRVAPVIGVVIKAGNLMAFQSNN